MKNKSKKYNKYKKHTLNKHNKTKKKSFMFEFNSPSSYAPSINKELISIKPGNKGKLYDCNIEKKNLVKEINNKPIYKRFNYEGYIRRGV